MEKRTAHYDLAVVILRVRQHRASAFTKTALDGGRRMGLTLPEMIETVSQLTPRCLYKSMTTYADNNQSGRMSNHADTKAGKAYIKLTLREDGAPVIQFKEWGTMSQICLSCDAAQTWCHFRAKRICRLSRQNSRGRGAIRLPLSGLRRNRI